MIRTPGGESRRYLAPGETIQPPCSRLATTPVSSGTGTHTFIPLRPRAAVQQRGRARVVVERGEHADLVPPGRQLGRARCVLEAPGEEVAEISALVRRVMEGAADLAVRLAVDVGLGSPRDRYQGYNTPSLRGVNVQRLFGSQRALKTVEDFTEFEQRAAYFDGDPVIATKKGVNPLERGSQVHFMAEFQELLDFPPAPKLSVVDGKLDPRRASPAELRGHVAEKIGKLDPTGSTVVFEDGTSNPMRFML